MGGVRLGRAPVVLLVAGFAMGAFSLTFTHLAGSLGGPGFEDGVATDARFKSDAAIAVDSSGNLYVADSGNHTIRVVSPASDVTTLAGLAETSGSTDGRGAHARFKNPSGILVDGSGTVYVADTGNHTIRKIVSGVSSTFVGYPGLSGYINNTGGAARFNSPRGLALDGSGNLYVADTGNHSIRMVTAGGVVTTLAGTGAFGSSNATGTAASFNTPIGLAFDASSNALYVADSVNRVIRQITLPGAVVTTFAGTMGVAGHVNGSVGVGRMYAPSGIASDGLGGFYATDSTDHTLRSITSGGSLGSVAGFSTYPGPDDGTGLTTARFRTPGGVAVRSGVAYVADTGNHTVRKVSLGSGDVVSTFAGLANASGFTNDTGGNARFNGPTGLAFYPAPAPEGFAYVSDAGNNAIRRVGVDGVVTTLAGGTYGYQNGNGTSAWFRTPSGLALAFPSSVYVADTGNHCIRFINGSGDVSLYAGQPVSPGSTNGDRLTEAKFSVPRGVALNSTATALYVADTGNYRVRRIDTGTGQVTTLAGSGSFGNVDANGTLASFGTLSGIMVDSDENVWVTESAQGTVRKIEPDGDVTTPVGSSACCGPLDGTGTAARFGYPGPTSISSLFGTTYIADPHAHLLRTFDRSTLAVGTAGGKASVSGTSDGTGTFARFNGATDVAAAGTLVLSEGHSIRYGGTEIADRAVIDSSAGLVGNVRQLDLSPQTASSWQWSIIRKPAGSAAALSSTTIRNPTFTPDVPDMYVFRCKATSATGVSISTVVLNGNGPATTFTGIGYAGPVNAGFGSAVVISATDAWGNVADGYTGTVHFTTSDDLATMPSDYTFTAGEHGTHTFIITLKRSGLQSVTLTDTVSGSITGTGYFYVSAGAATTFSVGIASSVASGVATDVTVTAKDTYDNTADGYLGAIHFTSSDGLATLPSDTAFNSGDLGVKTFTSGVTLRTAGAQSVSATDVADGGITGSGNATVSPAAPAGFTATRSGSQIQLSWTAPPGAIANYDLLRASPTSGGWTVLTTVPGTAHLDTTVSPGTAYAYKALARIAAGATSPYSVPDASTTIVFTDDPLTAGTTKANALHVSELRAAINSLRACAGLPAYGFTDDPVNSSTLVKAVHVQQLRTALGEARTSLGLSALSFTDPSLAAGTLIRGAHQTDIRDGVK